VQQLGLTDYLSVFWHSRQIDKAQGNAEGTVTTKGGDAKPVTIRLVRDQRKWAVVSVRYGGVDLVSIKAPPPLPAEAELQRMVAAALLDFNQAIWNQGFVVATDDVVAALIRGATHRLIVAAPAVSVDVAAAMCDRLSTLNSENVTIGMHSPSFDGHRLSSKQEMTIYNHHRAADHYLWTD
jgi:hypothetical protein